MAIGWVTDLADAESYFSDERLETTAWDALLTTTGGKDEKTAVLTMAYNRLRFSKSFTIPTTPDATQAAKLRMAQCETAYYLAQHLADEDRRKGLQAQGVTAAGIVKENYSETIGQTAALPAVVKDILADMLVADVPFYAIDIGRDEDHHVADVPDDVSDLD